MIIVVKILLSLLLFHGSNGENHWTTMAMRFENAIRHLQEWYKFYPNNILNLADSPISTMRHDLFQNHFFSQTNTSDICTHDLQVLMNAASERELWAMKILDAWGKPLPSGLLNGNTYWLGNYDECIHPLYQLNNKSFVRQPINTQYCAVRLGGNMQAAPASLGIVLGVCLPASCDRQSIMTLIQQIFQMGNMTTMTIQCSHDREREGDDHMTGMIVLITILVLIACPVLIGTIIDIVHRLKLNQVSLEKSQINSENESSISKVYLQGRPSVKRAVMINILMEFSAIRTLSYIFRIKETEKEDSFEFLNGIRVLSLFWVILGHSFSFYVYYTSNILDLLVASRNLAFQFISSGIFSVDTFFLLSGFLTSVIFVRQVRKEKFSLRLMILYYVHRYIRLTPTFILVMFVNIYLTPYFGHGPLYPIKDGFESKGCRNGGWWTSLVYLGNFFKTEDTCLGVTWYLFNDMQFHWIAPLALIPFVMGRKKLAYLTAIFFIFISMGSILGIVLYYPNILKHALDTSNNSTGPDFYDKIYRTPWCRIAPYAFGILTGFIVIDTSPRSSINRYIRYIGNFLAIVLGLTCIFSIYGDYILVPGLNRASLIAYQVLSRPAWSISVSWLIFICRIGQGGIVNHLLSSPIWVPLARLNYAAYLIHATIMLIMMFNQSVPLYFQFMSSINTYVYQVFFSYLTAILLVIFVETPFCILEKKVFKR